MCEFAKHYKKANGRSLRCDDCPKQHTRHCEKEVEHGHCKRAAVSNRVHSSVAESCRTRGNSNGTAEL